MEGEKRRDYRKWDELIPDTLALIFNKLSLPDKLTVIPMVCKAWAKAVQRPYCWQDIDIDEWTAKCQPHKLVQMLWLLLPRSRGSLQKFHVSCVNNDQAFDFIAQHAGSLQTLTLRRSKISDSIVEKVAGKFPALTSLDLSYCCEIGARALEAIGNNCKLLAALSWNMDPHNTTVKTSHAQEACAIAKTMPKLKKLDLAYVGLNTESILLILSSCPELESLDLSGCRGVHLDNKFLREKYPKLEVQVTSDSEYDYNPWAWGCGCCISEDSDDEGHGEAYTEYLLDLGFNP